MNKSESAKDIPIFLTQKLWEVYILTNEKRVKSFFYLTSTIIFLLLILIDGESKINFFGTNINVSTAVYILPLFIFILSLRYFALSALSFGNHSKFNLWFGNYKNTFDFSKTQFSLFKFDQLKSDDVNEFPNMFLIPIQIDKSNKINLLNFLKKRLKSAISLLEWIITLFLGAFHCSAILLYFYLFFFNDKIKGNFYLIILIGLLFAVIVYFGFGTKESRKYLKRETK